MYVQSTFLINTISFETCSSETDSQTSPTLGNLWPSMFDGHKHFQQENLSQPTVYIHPLVETQTIWTYSRCH